MGRECGHGDWRERKEMEGEWGNCRLNLRHLSHSHFEEIILDHFRSDCEEAYNSVHFQRTYSPKKPLNLRPRLYSISTGNSRAWFLAKSNDPDFKMQIIHHTSELQGPGCRMVMWTKFTFLELPNLKHMYCWKGTNRYTICKTQPPASQREFSESFWSRKL